MRIVAIPSQIAETNKEEFHLCFANQSREGLNIGHGVLTRQEAIEKLEICCWIGDIKEGKEASLSRDVKCNRRAIQR